MFLFCIEKKGRTLHLLKASSKPVPQARGRRKVDLLGTFDQFRQQHEEHKQEESMRESIRPQSPHQPQELSMTQPNIIGNAIDMELISQADQMPLPDLDDDAFGEPSGYKDITTQVMRTRKNKSKAHMQ